MKIKEFFTDRIAYYNSTCSPEYMPENIEAKYIYTDSIDHIEITRHGVSKDFPYCIWMATVDRDNMKMFQETSTREEAVIIANQLQKDIINRVCSEKYGSVENAKRRRPSFFYPAVLHVNNHSNGRTETIAAFKTEKDKNDFLKNNFKTLAEKVLNDEYSCLIKNDADPIKVSIKGLEIQIATAKSREESAEIIDNFYESLRNEISEYLEACDYYGEKKKAHLNTSILKFFRATKTIDDGDPFKQTSVRIIDNIKKIDMIGCNEDVLELLNECLTTAALAANAYTKTAEDNSRKNLVDTINKINETISNCKTTAYGNKLEEMIDKSNKITEELKTADIE